MKIINKHLQNNLLLIFELKNACGRKPIQKSKTVFIFLYQKKKKKKKKLRENKTYFFMDNLIYLLKFFVNKKKKTKKKKKCICSCKKKTFQYEKLNNFVYT